MYFRRNQNFASHKTGSGRDGVNATNLVPAMSGGIVTCALTPQWKFAFDKAHSPWVALNPTSRVFIIPTGVSLICGTST